MIKHLGIGVRSKSNIFLGLVLIITASGCASLRVDKGTAYPFKAGFHLQGTLNSKTVMMDGALVVNSSTKAMVEVYTPGGLAIYSIGISDGKMYVMDMWGKIIGKTTLPTRYIPALLAGFPPRGIYLYRSRKGEDIIVHYLWGRVCLDSSLIPLSVETTFDKKPVIIKRTATKEKDGNIELHISIGSDRILTALKVIHGGRW